MKVVSIDGTLYPDIDPPASLDTLGERIDFIARLPAPAQAVSPRRARGPNGVQVCSAWDFGLLPDVETVTELRRPEWRQVVDACRLLTSPTYHLLRAWQDLPALLYLGTVPAYIQEDPNLEFV